MKTIFVTSFHVFVSRNILSSPFFKMLQNEPGVRIVLIVPKSKKVFFQDEFGGSGVIVEGVERKLTHLDEFFKNFAAAAIHTRARSLMRGMDLGFERWYAQSILFFAPIFRGLIPNLYSFLMPKDRYKNLFDTYHPDLFFATDVFSTTDIILMDEAKSRRIPVVGMVRSWDNLTGKGGFRIRPDILVVNNQIIKDDAIRIHGIREDVIKVVGIPHYDKYQDGPTLSREQFLSSLGLGKSDRYVIFAPLGNRFFSKNTFDQDMIEVVLELLPKNYKLLVRFPPADNVDVSGLEMDPRMIIDRPGRHFSKIKDTELSPGDDSNLINSLAYADLMISGFTTLVVDSAFFDKPIVLINFDGKHVLPFKESVNRHYEFEHMQSVLKSGGVRLAGTKSELADLIRMYLENPSIDQVGRKKIISDQAPNVGQSSLLLLEVIKQQLC